MAAFGTTVKSTKLACNCGIPARAGKVASSYYRSAKRVYVCGAFPEKRCQFIQCIDNEEPRECDSCLSLLAKIDSLSVMAEETTREMEVIAGKFRFLLDFNNELRAEKGDLELRLEKASVECKRHLRGKTLAYCCLVVTWVVMASWFGFKWV